MITPGEGFFKPAASSLLIVLFCYLCESERENSVFFPEDFLLFLGSSQKEETAKHFLSDQETRKAAQKRRRKQTESIIINLRKLEGARAPKFTRTKRNERKSEVLPADTKEFESYHYCCRSFIIVRCCSHLCVRGERERENVSGET